MKVFGCMVWLLCPLLLGCGEPSASATVDGGDGGSAATLSLTIAVSPPVIEGLTSVSGELELHRVGVFADVAGDTRTMVQRLELKLPGPPTALEFPDAPYGLYSHVGGGLDDITIEGSWRGTPLIFAVEVENLSIDLHATATEYGPTQSAHFDVNVDMTRWFDATLLDNAVVDQGRILIDARHNTDLAVTMSRSVQASFAVVPTASGS